MKARIHVSYPENLGTPLTQRKWLFPESICEQCVHILGGDLQDAQSIAIQKGYLTQSQERISLPHILESLGRDFIEVPFGEKIGYKGAIIDGFEYVFENNFGAWEFHEICQKILFGYSDELVDTSTGIVRSIGKWRRKHRTHDGGPRYLIKYAQKDKRKKDLLDIYDFEQDPEKAQKKCHELDDLETVIC